MESRFYVNGYLDVSRSPAGPYRGTRGHLTIGTRGLSYPNSHFDDCLDSISYYSRAKDATEGLNDATLVDSGPLKINGTGSDYSFTDSGRVNKALTLSAMTSYIQVTGLRRIGTKGFPYSVAIWIKTTSRAGGTIMHLSIRTDGAYVWCLPMIGLTSSGQMAINTWNNADVPLNTWTHVVATYSPTTGEHFYVNNVLVGSSDAFTFSAGGAPMTMTLGSSLKGTGLCNTGTIQMGQFDGSLDEFHVYARELAPYEISVLYNV